MEGAIILGCLIGFDPGTQSNPSTTFGFVWVYDLLQGRRALGSPFLGEFWR